MAPIEWHAVTPEEMIREIEEFVRRSKEDKYAFQVGLKDVDFEINVEMLDLLGLKTPFSSISEAEQALSAGAIQPMEFKEHDDTSHQILAFDPRPVGYSGFMDYVTHSLAITNLGLFEVGRYPGVSLTAPSKQWQWFLHRRLATPEEVATWLDENQLVPQELIELVYASLTGEEK